MSESLSQNKPFKEDLSSPEWDDRLADAPVYAKNVKVHIRTAIPGEEIVTKVSDGTEETVNKAQENDVVITNPDGEEYILAGEKAMAEYAPTEEAGVFRSHGMVRAIENPTGGSIEINPPWGGTEVDGPDCMVAATFDPYRPDIVSSNRYLIARQEFQDTYMPVNVQLAAAA